MYGESPARSLCGRSPSGLSPRVRGIPAPGLGNGAASGSIPACTGNPAAGFRYDPRGQVYPRVYGESAPAPAGPCAGDGLSPRVRGIRGGSPGRRAGRGSIPACTGNPPRDAGPAGIPGVYPRVYGESIRSARRWSGARGLSPRVRGILNRLSGQDLAPRSIPACTGNPDT